MDALRKFTYPRATAVIVQTERTLAWLDSCCPKSRGSVIPNPVLYPLPRGEPFLKPTSIVDETKHLLLAVGRLDTQKGFDQLLTAFGMLAERLPHWDLVILGEGQERKALETQKDLLGLAGRAHLPGRVGNPGDWYTRGDCYVMSSRFEGFPNTLLEAMAHGLPAISFDCETGPADIIREGVDGYLVPPLEGAMGLSQTMEMVMQDEDLRRQMGKAAVTVRERFSSERVMCAWDKILGLQEKASRDGG